MAENLPTYSDGEKYRVEAVLEETAFSSRSLATDPQGRPIILKTALTGLGKPKKAAARLKLEKQLLEQVRAAGLRVPEASLEEEEGRILLARDHLRGATLEAKALAEPREFDLPEAFAWLQSVFGGVQMLHDLGYACVNLDPAAMMVRPEQELMLTELGDARPLVAEDKDTGGGFGPTGLRPPELRTADDDFVTIDSDAFSAACLVCFVLTGRKPDQDAIDRGEAQGGAVGAWIQDSWPREPWAAAPLSGLLAALATCLAPEPADRQGGFAQLRSAVTRAVAGLGGAREQARQDAEEAPEAEASAAAEAAPELQLAGGKYIVKQTLGEGAYGTVHLAETAEGFQVAIKQLHRPEDQDEEAEERLRAEGEALRWLYGLPMVPHLVEVVSEGQDLLLVEEHIAGPTLQDILELPERSYSLGDAVLWLWGVGRTIARLHEIGYVYQDTKPTNVIVARSGTPVLVDYGSVRRYAAEDGDPRALFGSDGFIAPELDDAATDIRTARPDVFSVGCLAYVVLGGHGFSQEAINAGEDVARLITSDLEKAWPEADWSSGAPAHLIRAVWDCLRPNPAERPESLTDLLEALASVAATAGTGERVTRLQQATDVVVSRAPSATSLAVTPQELIYVAPDTDTWDQQVCIWRADGASIEGGGQPEAPWVVVQRTSGSPATSLTFSVRLSPETGWCLPDAAGRAESGVLWTVAGQQFRTGVQVVQLDKVPWSKPPPWMHWWQPQAPAAPAQAAPPASAWTGPHPAVGGWGTGAGQPMSFGRAPGGGAMLDVHPQLSPVETQPGKLDFSRVYLDDFRSDVEKVAVWSKDGTALYATVETDVDWLEANPLYLEGSHGQVTIAVLPGLMSLNQILSYQAGNVYLVRNGQRVGVIMCEAYLMAAR